MPSKSAKRFVLLLSPLVGLAFAWFFWGEAEARQGHVRMINNFPQLEELLETTERVGEPEAFSPLKLIERTPWTPELADVFFPMIKQFKFFKYDEVLGYRRTGMKERFKALAEHPEGRFLIVVNDDGLRDGPLTDGFDVRVVFAGDSQTEGVCGTWEAFPNLVEAHLRAEYSGKDVQVVNAALGGSNPWRYLATLEMEPSLSPDIFVAVFYGGNDFQGVIALERFYRGRGIWDQDGRAAHVRRVSKLPQGLNPVELEQIHQFIENPADAKIAVDTWTAIAMEMQRHCQRLGIEFVPVYLPPPLAGQPIPYAGEREAAARIMPEVASRLDSSHGMADDWIANLKEHTVEVFDLRADFAKSEERLYWDAGYHLNLKGQALVARALHTRLAPSVRALLEKGGN